MSPSTMNLWETQKIKNTHFEFMFFLFCPASCRIFGVFRIEYNILVEYEELEKDDRTKYIVTYKVPVDGEEIVYN